MLVEVEYLGELLQAFFFDDFTYLVLLILNRLLKRIAHLCLLVLHFNIGSHRKRDLPLPWLEPYGSLSLGNGWHAEQIHEEAIRV